MRVVGDERCAVKYSTSLIRMSTTTTPSFLTTNTLNLKSDIDTLQASIMNALLMGDQTVGVQGNADVVKQIVERNMELKDKKTSLEKTVKKQDAIINRSNRDFSDVKDALPERLPKRTLQTIEDQTLAVVLLAYLFMIMAFTWWYASQATVFLTGLMHGAALSAVLSLIVGLLGYYFL